MTTTTISERTLAIIARELGHFLRPTPAVDLNTMLREEMDSLSVVSLAIACEEAFNIAITDDELACWASAGDVVRTVEGKANG